MPNGNNCSAECAPERGNEPPARGNTLGEQGTKQAAPRQGADSKERIQLGRLQRGCQRHQTKVASHTEKPLGFSKWLGRATPHPEPCLVGKGQGLLMSPTQGQADIIWATLAPAISQPLWGQLYGWLPLSNAYGISFPCDTTQI